MRPELRPADAGANADDLAFTRALALFHAAAERVPAYKHFLHKHGIEPARVRSRDDFAHVPLTDKTNYFSQYSLAELSWDGRFSAAKYVSMSSGSTGEPYFWPRGAVQDDVTGEMFQHLYERIFDAKVGTTLCLNSFVLGTWMAGLESYGATKWVSDRDNAIVVATPGPDTGEVIRHVKRLGGVVDRVVITGYPPFIKDILEAGRDAGVAWETFDTRLLVAGEGITEKWRDRAQGVIGREGDFRTLINFYGMSETGPVGHETPLTIAFRRALAAQPSALSIDQAQLAGVYQYYPSVRFIESGPGNALYLTSPAGLPLIRYNTHDEGGILSHRGALEAVAASLGPLTSAHGVDPNQWAMPLVYLYGRRDLSITFYGLMLYVEHFRAALENVPSLSALSGLFTMSTDHDEALDQKLCLRVELAKGHDPTPELGNEIRVEVIRTLSRLNPGYAKGHAVLGVRAEPHIDLIKNGEMGNIPGRKHRWVKR